MTAARGNNLCSPDLKNVATKMCHLDANLQLATHQHPLQKKFSFIKTTPSSEFHKRRPCPVWWQGPMRLRQRDLCEFASSPNCRVKPCLGGGRHFRARTVLSIKFFLYHLLGSVMLPSNHEQNDSLFGLLTCVVARTLTLEKLILK